MSKPFESGDEVLFHLASFGALVVPLPRNVVEQTGMVAGTELNMMHGIFRDEDETHYVVDVTSVSPPLFGTRLLKVGVDLIGVKGKIQPASGGPRKLSTIQ